LDPTLLVIGTNHRAAPVEFRERFWIPPEERPALLAELLRTEGVDEAVVLATCNRTEFIVWATKLDAATSAVLATLERRFGLAAVERGTFYRLPGFEALHHVFRVAASLDSMVLGEPEITGQVKSAWMVAREARATGRHLDALFQKALNVAKRVRSETAVGLASVSVPYAAVELARQIFGTNGAGGLAGRTVMILGAGKMGERSARYLLSSGASALYVTNRTWEHAVALAEELGGTPVRFEERWKRMAEADVVISSTGAPQPIFTRADAERVRRERGGRPLFLIDIAVPRDVDPAVRDVPGVFLYNIDDLEQVVERNRGERREAAVEAERLVAREAERFRSHLEAVRVVPTIVALRERLDALRDEALARYACEYGPLGQAEQRAVERFAGLLVERLSNELARELRRSSATPEQDRLAAALRRLFGLRAHETEDEAEAEPALTGPTS
jgi:glutamyl-tRNA reductase